MFRQGSAGLENEWVRESVRRVRSAEAIDLENLERGCRDYANWSDTYSFIDDASLPYAEVNLLPSMFANLRLDAVLLFYPDGRLRLGRRYDGEVVTDTGLEDLVTVVTPFAKDAIAQDGVNGIIRVKGQVAMVSVLPIHYDDGSGAPNGALAQIRLLGPAWVERLRESLNLDIVLRNMAEVSPGPLAPQSHSAVEGAAPFTTLAISDKVMNLRLPLADLHGTSVGYWDVTLERKINLQGIQARFVFNFVLFVLIIAAAGVIGGLLRWMVIARLEELELAVRRVGVTSDLSSRLPLTGSDELTSLTDGINKMLQALADANERRVAAERAEKSSHPNCRRRKSWRRLELWPLVWHMISTISSPVSKDP